MSRSARRARSVRSSSSTWKVMLGNGRLLLARGAQGPRHGAGDLFARTGDDGVADGLAPAVVVDVVGLEPDLGEHGRVVEVTGDLLGAAAGGEVLGAVQRRPALRRRQVQQVLGDERDRAPGAALPRRVGGGVHDDLAHDAPARVMGLAARDQEAGERFGENGRIRLLAVGVEVAERLADALAAFDGARELTRPAAGSALETGRTQAASGVLRVTCVRIIRQSVGASDDSARRARQCRPLRASKRALPARLHADAPTPCRRR